jgi:hypothetical protein
VPWRPTVAAVLAAAALAGCDSGADNSEDSAAERRMGGGVLSYEGRVIRGWLLALERQNYEEAAYYFAPGALIDQGEPYRLRDDSAARAFNASLPCRAELVRLEDEGRRVLASFELRRGPGGPCAGIVRVRFTIRDGKFTVWRQLPGEDERPGETI